MPAVHRRPAAIAIAAAEEGRRRTVAIATHCAVASLLLAGVAAFLASLS
ncbi:hypothetical protein OCK02_12840 [Rhizobium sp. TRM96647]|nr:MULTISPECIES: hypothetical protein [unclassified Rhizobium]MCV3737097.1 hypothetical protein [Rhizobium sp. TRM96647]MCV3759081.1 hypothetical protein [Rhizobium sp. TRM96650]